ncbi:MAG: hypothetical protein GY777_09840 [Candidatus Brocadiaceae bacterium]|nr:hypothetical protein [Candidatus Brocadiaceae bacterium]
MNIKRNLFLIRIVSFTLLFLSSTHYASSSENINIQQEIRSEIIKGISLYKKGLNNEALQCLEDVINRGVISPEAHYILGNIYYDKNDLQNAIKNWEIAQRHSPNEAIHAKIVKATKELKLDDKLSDKISCNFLLKYDQDDTYSSELVLHSLINAYNQLAYDFGWYENSEFTVILYSHEDFTNILNVPSWAAAIYDGKIRIPFNYASLDIDELESIIRHELTHAILHRMAGNRVPAWLHEGIAQYKDGVNDSDVKKALKEAVINNRIIPISKLQAGFGSIKDTAQVKVAYSESLSFIEYLINNYGFYTILDILNNFNNHTSLNELFHYVYRIDLNRLEKDWIEHLKLLYL